MHFSPETILKDRFSRLHRAYVTANISDDEDLTLNIEAIDLADGSFTTVICNHVLEHVNDKMALREIYRILPPEGKLICSVPLIEGWDQTYENPNVKSAFEKTFHFDQSDHLRLYGKDFRDRVRAAGFLNIEEITAQGEDCVKYGLIRGEKIFICTKN